MTNIGNGNSKRFIKQFNSHNCAAIAVYNVLKEFGYRLNREIDLPKIEERLHTSKQGTDTGQIHRYLTRNRYFSATRKLNCTIEDIDKYLNKGYIVYYCLYYKSTKEFHAELCIGKNSIDNTYLCVNHIENMEAPLVLVERERLKYLLRSRPNIKNFDRRCLKYRDPVLWALKKKG